MWFELYFTMDSCASSSIKINSENYTYNEQSFFLFLGLVFELRVSHLQSRLSTTWATPPVHFVLLILEMGSCEQFAQTGARILLISASPVAGITGAWLEQSFLFDVVKLRRILCFSHSFPLVL
jgi:hypothetical protein